jgi:pSer/pThr/pTyr-binding forkhead associated (FHA) protein
MAQGGQRWFLRQGNTTIGRDPSNNIPLDMPIVREKRLVSGKHAYIRAAGSVFDLFDGDPSGKPSVNGTFVNQRLVPPSGARLQEGDLITLAALDPLHPRLDTPGVVSFRFRMDCRE